MAYSETFFVYTDSGEEMEAIVIHRRIDTSTLDGSSSIPGIATIRLLNGLHLNRIDDNTFEIVETGEIVKRKR